MKDTLKLSTIWKTSNKKKCFWCVKVYIFWRFTQYVIEWDKIQMFSFGQNKRYKAFFASSNSSQFYFELAILISYISWSKKLISLKLCVGFSVFESVSFLLKFIFFMNSLTLKRHNPWKTKILKMPNSFAPRPLISNLQQ